MTKALRHARAVTSAFLLLGDYDPIVSHFTPTRKQARSISVYCGICPLISGEGA
jgi:hypothetical protein